MCLHERMYKKKRNTLQFHNIYRLHKVADSTAKWEQNRFTDRLENPTERGFHWERATAIHSLSAQNVRQKIQRPCLRPALTSFWHLFCGILITRLLAFFAVFTTLLSLYTKFDGYFYGDGNIAFLEKACADVTHGSFESEVVVPGLLRFYAVF